MSPELRVFLFGLLGSLAVEVANIVRVYEAGKPLSVRYTRPVFLIARLVLAVFSGLIAIAHNPPTDLLALHIGAATPAILQLLASRPPD